jgi:hypothetical protein
MRRARIDTEVAQGLVRIFVDGALLRLNHHLYGWPLSPGATEYATPRSCARRSRSGGYRRHRPAPSPA